MIPLSDRKTIIGLVDRASTNGARRAKTCAEIGISDRSIRRWQQGDEVRADQRATAQRPSPSNKLSDQERLDILNCIKHDLI